MTREDIIHMAREAGCGWARNGTEPLLLGETQLRVFARLVAAHEREECAKVCDAFDRHVAAAVRARGNDEN